VRGDRTGTKREMEKWRDDRMEEGARRGWLRATRPRSDCLRSRSPSHGGEGGSSGPIGKGEGRSEMEEGRGTAWESLERGVRGRGCEVWRMDDGGKGGAALGFRL
jgi:hypothetical protein